MVKGFKDKAEAEYNKLEEFDFVAAAGNKDDYINEFSKYNQPV